MGNSPELEKPTYTQAVRDRIAELLAKPAQWVGGMRPQPGASPLHPDMRPGLPQEALPAAGDPRAQQMLMQQELLRRQQMQQQNPAGIQW